MHAFGSRWFLPFLLLCVGPGCTDDDLPGEGETGEEVDIDVFPGLGASVEVRRDALGVAHLYGQSDLDVMHAAGYQMASDRLFQMDLVRRRALGRQAEVLGPDKVAQDELSRLMNFRDWGRANMEALREGDPETYQRVVAWVAGVNRRIDEVLAGEVALPTGFGPEALDYLPERWELSDHFAIARLYFFASSAQVEEELLATLLEDFAPEAWEGIELARPMFPAATMPPDELPEVVARPREASERPAGLRGTRPRPAEVDWAELGARARRLHGALGVAPKTGSNNWAIDGQHSANGRPLIAGDPHQPLDSPSVMYALHLNSTGGEGSIDAIGFSFVGVAGVALGHNAHLAWTATTNFADTSDSWLLEASGGEVRVGDEMVELVVREERIEVAGEAAQTYVVEDVPGYGVILPDSIVPIPIAKSGEKLLFNWVGFRPTLDESAFLGISSAEDLDAFEARVDALEISGFNFIGADETGISYRVGLEVPDRGDPSARRMPFTVSDGNDASSFWSGYLPPERVPASRGGARGWLTTANNDPWGFTFDGDVGNDPWYYGHFFAAGHRAYLLLDRLEALTAEGDLDLTDMEALQIDTYSATSDVLVPLIESAWESAQTDASLASYRDDEDVARLVELLSNEWDRQMAVGSPGALAYHLTMMFASDEALGDELGLFWETILEAEAPYVIKMPLLALDGQYPASATLVDDGVDATVLEGVRRAASWLEGRYGSVDPGGYSWGDMHGTLFDNPYGGSLEGGWFANGGGEDTINVSSSQFFDAGAVADRFDSTQGAVYRMVAGFDEDGTPRARVAFPMGNVGEPDSPFWDNNLDLWLEGSYVDLPFRRDEVEAATVESWSFDAPD